MRRFVNANGEHKGNNLEQDVDVLEGHVLIEEFENCRIANLQSKKISYSSIRKFINSKNACLGFDTNKFRSYWLPPEPGVPGGAMVFTLMVFAGTPATMLKGGTSLDATPIDPTIPCSAIRTPLITVA